jgi:hypothetical protein
MDTTPTPRPEGLSGLPDCVELGVWTNVPVPPHRPFRLKFKDVDDKRHRAVKKARVLTFHAVGCTGCHADQRTTALVAQAMALQAGHPRRFGGGPDASPASFLYHLGDVVYKHDKDTAGEQSPLPPPPKRKDFGQLYDEQFYGPYAGYAPPVFAVAGNHDGKDVDPEGASGKSAIHHFLKNFCGLHDGGAPDNRSSPRVAAAQPYPYWLLRTPLAWFIGLYSNVNNAGQLDNPHDDARPQFDWLVRTLQEVRKGGDGRAVFLVVHYPPYSAAANFAQRGNPNFGPTPRPPGKRLRPLGVLLQEAFRASGEQPDVVLSAHAHLYQRLTYTHADGRQTPYLVAGAGGHAPVEKLSAPCWHDKEDLAGERPRVVYPEGLRLPEGDTLALAAHNDRDFGFLRLTVDGGKHRLTGEYFTVADRQAAGGAEAVLDDSFSLDLRSHVLRG